MSDRTHVIRFGNHWLQSDDHCTDPQWADLAHATLHTKNWADKYAERQAKQNVIAEVFPVEVAIEHERQAGLRLVKSKWLYAFEYEVRKTFSGYTENGLWTNAHMYHGMNLSVPEATERFGRALNLTRLKPTA